MADFLIYGVTGYTGELIARDAKARGMEPVLAGRDAARTFALARELGLSHRAFGLDDPAAIEAGLAGMRAVLHCAGPFARTSKPMADACLRTGVHYLDITGEILVFETLAARGDEARASGVMLLPGAGMDVVPSDCLAAHLKRRLPAAQELVLAFFARGRASRGTATTMIENLHQGGVVRRGGALTGVPAAWKTRDVDFGSGPVPAMLIPWGDVSTAFHSTGIPDIEVYTAASAGVRLGVQATRYLGWFLGSRPVQDFLKRRVRAGPAGPTDEQRRRGHTVFWGEAKDRAGRRAASRLYGPEGYTFTVLTALAIVERVLAGEAPAGFATPSRAYGADFVLTIPGVTREDLR